MLIHLVIRRPVIHPPSCYILLGWEHGGHPCWRIGGLLLLINKCANMCKKNLSVTCTFLPLSKLLIRICTESLSSHVQLSPAAVYVAREPHWYQENLIGVAHFVMDNFATLDVMIDCTIHLISLSSHTCAGMSCT